MSRTGLQDSLETLASKFAQLPEAFPTQATVVSFGANPGPRVLETVAAVCRDAARALSQGIDVNNRPIAPPEIADGLRRLVLDARGDTGAVAMVLNPTGIQTYVGYLDELERLADLVEDPAAAALQVEDPVAAALQLAAAVDACFYCGKRPRKAEADKKIAMYEEVGRSSTMGGAGVRWRSASIPIARCNRCKTLRDRSLLIWLAFPLLLLLPVLLVPLAPEDSGGPWDIWDWLVIIPWLLALAAVVAGVVRGAHYVNKDHSFPAMQLLEESGWKTGSRPAGARPADS